MAFEAKIINRFRNKVDKQGPYPKKYTKLKTRCWIWTAYRDTCGYGNFGLNGSMILAHRFAYILQYGKDSLNNKQALHKCDNPACVRPSHLFAGTQLDNKRDMDNKGRRAKGEALSKLSTKDIIKIRKLYDTGQYVCRELGKMFGVTTSHIGYIVRRQTWAHI